MIFIRCLCLPVLPQGLQIMADQGFANQSPILIPLSGHGRPMTGVMKRDFSSCRSAIERVFGSLKSSYSLLGTKCYRSKCFLTPLLLNLCTALGNRQKKIFNNIREQLRM